MQKTNQKTQKDKFIETARALGCDESEAAFDAKLKKLLSHKPISNEQVKKQAKKRKKLD